MNSHQIIKFLEGTYDHILDGLPGVAGVETFAKGYLKGANDVEDAIGSLIRWQVGQASAIGFGSNIGGLLTLPIAIPLNLGGVAAIQMRMVAAIAQLRGYDVRSVRVRQFTIVCLMGNAATELLKEVGIQVGTKLATQAVNQISRQTLQRINQVVGFRLVTKAGTAGATNLIKWVPLVGGVVGGTIDGLATAAVAQAAKKIFQLVPSADPSQPLTIDCEVIG